ncbi:hypothetical protein U1Q18_052176 [Sarracenia purpurea var. burkii]
MSAGQSHRSFLIKALNLLLDSIEGDVVGKLVFFAVGAQSSRSDEAVPRSSWTLHFHFHFFARGASVAVPQDAMLIQKADLTPL